MTTHDANTCDPSTRSRFLYWFRHPMTRIGNVVTFSILNCVLFSKDPIGHSPAEARVPVLGPALKFLIYMYPFLSAWGLFLKTMFAIIYLITGMLFGKYILHDYLFRDKFGWRMFYRDKGSWFCMLVSSVWSLYTGAFLFNIVQTLFHRHIGEDQVEIGDGIGWSFAELHEFLSVLSLTFNVFTFVMVSDDILQDRRNPSDSSVEALSIIGAHFESDPYPNTWVVLKNVYRARHGFFRILLFWTMSIILFILHVFVIEFERLDHEWIHSDLVPVMSEFGRSTLASIVFSLELICIMQDEEFPRFSSEHQVRLVGLNAHRVHLALRNYTIVITGKWYNYSLVILTVFVDFIMFDYQFTYKPKIYHQSVDKDGYIIYTGGILEKATYKQNPENIMYLTTVPMLITILGFVYCLVKDARRKTKEKEQRKPVFYEDDEITVAQ